MKPYGSAPALREGGAGGVADGVPPASPALAEEHQLGRNTLHEAAERLVDQGHLGRDENTTRVIDPLLGEWL
jgi:hypothetical protein